MKRVQLTRPSLEEGPGCCRFQCRVGCRPVPRSDRARDDLTTAVAQAHTQVTDLEDRLKASVAAEREASARSNQQATSLAELSARLQQQRDSSRANDERISQSLRQRRDRGADRDSAVPVPAFFIVGYTGGQRIIIVHIPRPCVLRVLV